MLAFSAKISIRDIRKQPRTLCRRISKLSSGTFFPPPRSHKTLTNYYAKVFFPLSQLTLATGAAATYVYGQENLTTCSPQGMPNTRSSLDSPLGVTVTPDGSALFITDYGHNRVVLHSVTPPTLPNGQAAVDLFGQPNFTSSNAGSAASLTGLNRPTLTLYDPVKDSLWVTDLLNNRVMAYTNVLVAVNNNISGLDVHLTFVGRSPSVWMYPKSKT